MKKGGILLVIIIFISSCSVQIATDYDRKANFEKYKTYNYFSDIKFTPKDSIYVQDYYRVIDSAMMAKGFTKETNPEILVDVLTDEKIITDQSSSINIGGGNSGGGIGIGVGVNIPIKREKISKSIEIELVDAENKHLVWQAQFHKNIPLRSDKPKLIRQVIQKMFKEYPPKK